MIGAVLAALAGCSAGPALESTRATALNSDRAEDRVAAAVSNATGSALQGNAASAMKILASVPATDFTGEAKGFRDCMFTRFGATDPVPPALGDDPWIAALGNAYVSYWRDVLVAAASVEAAERTLAAMVGSLIGRRLATAAELDHVESEMLDIVQAHGMYALLGRTPPLRELMLWKKQTVLEREVDLPGGRERVQVFLLDDFILRGWGHYATCGRRSAGGWTTDAALFAVAPAYANLDDEVFSVRFLGHEAQHFADKRMFPGLENWELEYRAKLVELSLGSSSQSSTLKLFCENRADSKDAPHGYANARIVREVSGRLGVDESTLCADGDVPKRTIQELGRKLLQEDTDARKAHSSEPPSRRVRPA